MTFATWQVGQLFWSMLWFSLFFVLIWMVVSVFADIFRSPDLSGWAKALWTLFVIFMPWLGILLYMVIRGRSMGERRYASDYPSRDAWGYGPSVTYGPPVAASPTGDLTSLAGLRERGVIDDAEFQAMKQRVVAP